MEPKLELLVPKRRRFHRIPGLYWVSDSSFSTNEFQRVADSCFFRPPGGSLNYSINTNLSITTAATVAVPAPTNALNGSTRNCGDWYTVSRIRVSEDPPHYHR